MSSNLSTEMLQPVLAAFTWDPDWKTNGRTIGNGPLQVKRGFLHIVHYHWTKLSKYAFTAMIPAFNLQTCPTSTTLRRGWRANPIVEGCRSTRRCTRRASTTPPGYIFPLCSLKMWNAQVLEQNMSTILLEEAAFRRWYCNPMRHKSSTNIQFQTQRNLCSTTST